MKSITLSVSCVIFRSPLGMLQRFYDSICLASKILVAQYPEATVRLQFIDNSVDSEYFDAIQTWVHELSIPVAIGVDLFQASVNSGYGTGNNIALNQTRTDFHLIVNPDITLSKNALLSSVEYLLENKDVELVTPRVEEVGGHMHHVAKTFPDILTLMIRYLNLDCLNRQFDERLDRYRCAHLSSAPNKEVEMAGGCYLFTRADSLREIGGFDEKYFMYFEDFDLSIRIRSKGKIAYVPQVQIRHEGGDVGRKHWRHHLYFVRSMLRFFWSHGLRLY